jgi:sugar phosphate isomerase/epimerase
MARIGLMLYTVRADSARDLEGTLRAVAGMGYEGVELFDLHGHEPGRVRGWLDNLGLGVAGRHVSLEAVESQLPELAAEAETLGTPRVIVGWIEPPATVAGAQATADRLANAAEEAAALQLELGFHNHDGELRPLEDGRSFLDLLLELPIFLELDLGWAWWAGVDPVELLERTRGRVPLVHVKDFRARGERTFCPVGDGGVGYEHVAPAAASAGVEWLLVEQDEADGSALDAARRSLAALTQTLETA